MMIPLSLSSSRGRTFHWLFLQENRISNNNAVLRLYNNSLSSRKRQTEHHSARGGNAFAYYQHQPLHLLFSTQSTAANYNNSNNDSLTNDDDNDNDNDNDNELLIINQQDQNNDKPWKSLLEMPARAAWRASAASSSSSSLSRKIIDNTENDESESTSTIDNDDDNDDEYDDDDDDGGGNFSTIHAFALNSNRIVDMAKNAVLDASVRRTNVQLRQTEQFVIEQKKSLVQRRDNERLRILTNNKQGQNKPNNSNNSSNNNKNNNNNSNNNNNPVISYGIDETLQHIQHRLVPQYSIVKRVLQETKSLLMSTKRKKLTTNETSNRSAVQVSWQPQRIIDFGIGCGSASAAALDVFGDTYNDDDDDDNNNNNNNIEWIHGIDPSYTMRETSQLFLKEFIQLQNEEKLVLEQKQKQQESSSSGLNNRDGRTSAFDHNYNSNQTRITVSAHLSASPSPLSESATIGGGSVSGSFDLALMVYTASELTHTSATLAAAALLWEKLRPNGVFVMIEPGTPDGFTSVRSVRNMLLDCVNNKNEKLIDDEDDDYFNPADYTTDEDEDSGGNDGNDSAAYMKGETTCKTENYIEEDRYVEECHVIAPCTHNGPCPLDRYHQMKLNLKKRSNKSLYKQHPRKQHQQANYQENESDDNDVSDNDWGNNTNDEDNIDDTDGQTHQGFCSFVQTMPRSSRNKKNSFGSNKGEKFSYLVLQKRIIDRQESLKVVEEDPAITTKNINNMSIDEVAFEELSVTDLLRRTLEKQSLLQNKQLMSDEMEGEEALLKEEALQFENLFLSSSDDPLGLELLRGDTNRKSFGRIIRAPKKKKRHVVIDLCCTPGIIRRYTIGKSLSSKMPGIYSAARKSRWGGFWPDVPLTKQQLRSNENKK